MKVLQVTAPAAFGGLERVVAALSRGLVSHEVEVTVALIHHPSTSIGPFAEELEANGARVVSVPVEGRGYGKERMRVEELCRGWKPDVIHTHGYRCDVLQAAVARRAGIPHITTVHGFTGGGWKNQVYEGLQKRTFRSLSKVVAVSPLLQKQLIQQGVPERAVALIPNAWGGTSHGLDRESARAQLDIRSSFFRLGWVGRLSHEKGADLMIDALSHLADLDLSLSVVGDGPEMERLRASAADLGVQKRVQFHGAVPSAGELFRAFDAFVLSSRTEGTPIALLEAIAAEVPVVATAVGGVPDVVTPAEAVLVPSTEPAALAAGIRAVVADPSAAKRRAAAAGHRLRTHFAFDPWIDRYVEIYEEVQPNVVPGELCQAQS